MKSWKSLPDTLISIIISYDYNILCILDDSYDYKYIYRLIFSTEDCTNYEYPENVQYISHIDKYESKKYINAIINRTENIDIVCSAHSTYLLKRGNLYVSGDNQHGQLGLGDTKSRNSFEKVDIGNNIVKVVCGTFHVFIKKQDNSIWSCGYNSSGQLGLKHYSNRLLFEMVDINDVKDIICGGHFTYIITNNNEFLVCGSNDVGQIGNKIDDVKICTFTKLNIKINIKQISCGWVHAGFLSLDNKVYFHGSHDSSFRESDITAGRVHKLKNIKIEENINAKKIICGFNRTFLLDENNKLYGFGNNRYGALGLGDANPVMNFMKISIENVKQVVSGRDGTFLLTNDGDLYTSGNIYEGKLFETDNNSNSCLSLDEDDYKINKCIFNKINIGKVYKIAGGLGFIYAFCNDGSVWSCGENFSGQLGIFSNENSKEFSPVRIP